MIRKKSLLFYGGLLVATAAWIVVAFLCAGCAARVSHVTDLPPGVTEQQAKDWDAAVADLHKIADTTSALRKAVISLRGNGAFPNNQAYGTTILSLGRIDELQLAASTVLKQQPQHFDAGVKGQVAGLVKSILNELQNLTANGTAAIDNATLKEQITTLLNDLTGAVNLVVALTQ